MTEFITDEFGNKTFSHEGWVVKIWSEKSAIASRIDVESPDSDEQVEVRDGGLWTFGEARVGWDAPAAVPVSIPWIVLTAVIDARALVASEEK